ncbi:hypothetical protein GCM10020331_038200 [Ectobacillus funiculus]
MGVAAVDIANRTLEKKAAELIGSCRYSIQAEALTMQQAQDRHHEYDIIIQTTTLGMYPHVQDTPLQLQQLKRRRDRFRYYL